MTCPRCGLADCRTFLHEQRSAGFAGWVHGYTDEMGPLSCEEIAETYLRAVDRETRRLNKQTVPIEHSLFVQMASGCWGKS